MVSTDINGRTYSENQNIELVQASGADLDIALKNKYYTMYVDCALTIDEIGEIADGVTKMWLSPLGNPPKKWLYSPLGCVEQHFHVPYDRQLATVGYFLMFPRDGLDKKGLRLMKLRRGEFWLSEVIEDYFSKSL